MTNSTAQITATVERIGHGWTGQTSTGRNAHITDGQSQWFSDDFGTNGRLTDAEQSALDRAAMQALRSL